jgi:hypothetical protein
MPGGLPEPDRREESDSLGCQIVDEPALFAPFGGGETLLPEGREDPRYGLLLEARQAAYLSDAAGPLI